MSRKQFAFFEGQHIVAHNAAVGVFLKYLIDEAQASEHVDEPWLSDAVSHWRVQASIAEFGITLKEQWSSAQRQIFIELAEEACRNLATRELIPAEEVNSWCLVDGLLVGNGFDPRGKVPTAPIVELGRALIAVVSGKRPPKGNDWFYTIQCELTLELERAAEDSSRKASAYLQNPEVRERAQQIASQVLADQMGLIEAARELLPLLHRNPGLASDEVYRLFQGIDSETDHLPVGRIRREWSSDALREKDREIARCEELWRERVHSACERILSSMK